MISLNVPSWVRRNVAQYFIENGLNNYEIAAIGQESGAEYVYVVLAKKVVGNSWAVWTCWNESTQSLNYGHYDLTEEEAMRLFLHIDNKTDRYSEIATQCIWGLIEDDKEQALIFLRDEVELTEEECEYFGIDYEEMQEV